MLIENTGENCHESKNISEKQKYICEDYITLFTHILPCLLMGEVLKPSLKPVILGESLALVHLVP